MIKITKIFIANAFVNETYKSKYGLINPILENGKFELIPIKERSNISGKNILKYKEIMCYNSDESITKYFPERNRNELSKYYVHYDPEFETYTYGDILKKGNSRSSNLKGAENGDFLFFIANLYKYRENTYLYNSNRFYFVGYFKIERIIQKESGVENYSNQIKNNAHYRRYLDGFTEIGDFIIIKGDKDESKRFLYPFKITKDFCDTCLRDKNNYTFKWDKYHSETQCIGSYTRTIRAFLDKEKDETRWEKFWNEIKNHILSN
ncbi:MAG: hypothetical protein GF329_09440 [Candidatus Lokiarchaeota archaeon]|nr:hypothetical protein [Candidatus Lokiarchaeota archaeon]